MAFPIGIWQKSRHLLGLSDFSASINGDIVHFIYMVAVGAGDMNVTNDAGGRWGWEEDGSFTDAMSGAVSVAPLGPQDTPAHAMPLLLAMNQPAPTVHINTDGGNYAFHTGADGQLMQLEVDAPAGEQDQIQLGYDAADLTSMAFTPEHRRDALVPRVGLVISETDSALFHWSGLRVPGGKSVGFGGDKNAPRRDLSQRYRGYDPSHFDPGLCFGRGGGRRAHGLWPL